MLAFFLTMNEKIEQLNFPVLSAKTGIFSEDKRASFQDLRLFSAVESISLTN